jgi:Patatin-like phospholipase
MGGQCGDGLLKSQEVIAREKKLLGIASGKRTVGLALSGGGIRSASFGLGVLQALLANHVLEKIDYLSTVSGGGYIGAALTWFRKRQAGQGNQFFNDTNPFGKQHEGARTPAEDGRSTGNTFLSFLRQHGNYLAPDRKLNTLTLAANVLRSMIVSLLVYLALLVVAVSTIVFISHLACRTSGVFNAFGTLIGLEKNEPPPSSYITIDWSNDGAVCKVISHSGFRTGSRWRRSCLFRFSFLLFAVCMGSLPLVAVGYSIVTGIEGSPAAPGGAPEAPQDGRGIGRYRLRTGMQIISGWCLRLAIVFAVLATVPIVYAFSMDKIFSLGLLGSVSGIWAALARIRKHLGQNAVFKLEWVGTILFRLGAALFVYSMLVLAYHLTLKQIDMPAGVGADPPGAAVFFKVGALLVFSILVGWMANINYSTIGRMYRDRLMEAFLPNDQAIRESRLQPATDADAALLESMCREEDETIRRPYHIINSNVILVNSPDKRLRGRGGDSFILSPRFCGSDATGYLETRNFMKKTGKDRHGRMTLATAMATSGAAVNPNTGVAGKGVTRDFFVSLMMTIFNLRLGYWATNPCKGSPFKSPNYWWPGFCSLLGLGYREDNLFIELSDGGHFENLGLYELVRRRVDTIIVSDAGADKGFNFGDLANAIERVRVDFGVGIRFKPEDEQLGKMLPGSCPGGLFAEKFNLAAKGFVTGTIAYPKTEQEEKKTGAIYLIKSTLLPNLPGDLYGYKARHADFPDQTTSDQFFAENQFEAYRELGYRTANHLCRDTELAMHI